MTGRADSVRIAVVDAPPRVTERRAGPCRGVVTGSAVRRENSGSGAMNRIRRGVVVGLMASVASRRQCRVVVVYVAIRAGHRCVESRQRESRLGVIEFAVRPLDCVVAQIARRWETKLDMVDRSCCAVVVLQVARRTSGTRQVVVVVDVTVRAGSRWNGVRVREGETGRRMIELAVGPLDRVVTALTGCRESQLRVVDRRGCRVVVLQVARRASRCGQVVVVVDVAVEANARRVSVRIRQRKSHRSVIEGRGLPRDGRVASLAGLRESS